MQHRILVIDDEINIRETISQVLESNNFQSDLCDNPNHAIRLLKQKKFDLVILDIWMPEKDGHELLREIKKQFSRIPILVISGHINNHTSVELGKNGATDFLEKPFSSDFLIFKINKILNQVAEIEDARTQIHPKLIKKLDRKQRTIKKNVVLTGKGLHRGENNGIIISPLPENSGVIFQNIATHQAIQAKIENVAQSNFYSTTLQKGSFQLTVIEHLLSALHIYGIDNINIKVSSEIPIFDGSATKFCELIEEAGIKEQKENKTMIVIDREYYLEDEENSEIWCRIEPHDGFYVSYTLNFPEAFGEQHYEADLSHPQNRIGFYKDQIACCRTFGFLNEIRQLQSHGLAQGTDLENGLLVDQNRVINAKLKFQNEFARHKVLDVIGDLYLFGSEIQGKITGHYSGHRHNINLQRKIINQN